MFYMFYVCFLNVFFPNLYLYNTVLSVLFCVNKDIIITYLNVYDLIMKYSSKIYICLLLLLEIFKTF